MMTQCSNHSKDRIKERMGLNKKAADRIAEKAYQLGISHADTVGSLNKYITYLLNHDMYKYKDQEIKIYGRQVYIFDNKTKVLITVLNLPHQYDAIVDKLFKKKENNAV